jgi:hypothetical protein
MTVKVFGCDLEDRGPRDRTRARVRLFGKWNQMFETPRPRGAEPRVGRPADRRPVLKTGRLRWTLAGAERLAITDDGAAGGLSAAARPVPLKEDYRHA